MSPKDYLADVVKCCNGIIDAAEDADMDDEMRTLDFVCFHHRLGQVINMYATRSAQMNGRPGALIRGVK